MAKLAWLLAFMSVVGCANCATEVAVSHCDTYYTNAGKEMNCFGSGLKPPTGEFDVTAKNNGVEVKIFNNDYSAACNPIDNNCSPVRISFDCPHIGLKEGSLLFGVMIIVNGITATNTKYIQYVTWISPIIREVVPHFGLIQQVICFVGDFKTSTIRGVDLENLEDSKTKNDPMVTKLTIGNVECEYKDKNDNWYGDHTRYKICCKPKSTKNGPSFAAMYVHKYGASINSYYRRIDSKNVLHDYFAHGETRSSNTQHITKRGGVPFQVNGFGFNEFKGATKVFIAGQLCETVHVTTNNILCLSPPEPQNKTTTPGEMGLLKECCLVNNPDFDSEWSCTNSDETYVSAIVRDYSKLHDSGIDLQDNSFCRITGFFEASKTVVHRFHANSDKSRVLYFDNNRANMNYVDILLKKGVFTFIEIRFIGNPTYFNLVFIQFDSDFVRSESNYVHNRVLKISQESKPKNLKLKITWSVGSEDILGNKKIMINHRISDTIDLTKGYELKSEMIKASSRICSFSPEKKDLYLYTDFENIDYNPWNTYHKGQIMNDSVAHCGSNYYRLYEGYNYLFNVDAYKDDVVDISEHRYFCLALRSGVVRHLMTFRMYYYDNSAGNGRYRAVDHAYSININPTKDEWDFGCIDLNATFYGSWAARYQHKLNKKIVVTRIWAPVRINDGDSVYIDDLCFSKYDMKFDLDAKSAIEDDNTFLDDIIVQEDVDNNAYTLEYVTSNCGSGIPVFNIDGFTYTSHLNTMQYKFGNGSEFNVTILQKASDRVKGTYDLLFPKEDYTVIGSPSGSGFELKNAIEAASGHSQMKGYRNDNCRAYEWRIEYADQPGAHEIPIAHTTKIIFSGEYSLKVEEYKNRAYFNSPTPDFFRIPLDETRCQYTVTVNDYPTICLYSDNCTINFIDDIEAATVTSAYISEGFLTFIGANFNGFAAERVKLDDNNFVAKLTNQDGEHLYFFNDAPFSDNKALFKMNKYLIAGKYKAQFYIFPLGRAETQDPLGVDIMIKFNVDNISPTVCGIGGGSYLNIEGGPFPLDITHWKRKGSGNGIFINGSVCDPIKADKTFVKCVVPSSMFEGLVDIIVKIDGEEVTKPDSLTYQDKSAVIIDISPLNAPNVAGGDELTINGQFGDIKGLVSVGSSKCEVISWNKAIIVCILPANKNGAHKVVVSNEEGNSRGDASVKYKLEIYCMSPNKGSTHGGTELSVTGLGFGNDKDKVSLSLGDRMFCEIISINNTHIKCITKIKHVTQKIALSETEYVFVPPCPKLHATGDLIHIVLKRKDVNFAVTITQKISMADHTPVLGGFKSVESAIVFNYRFRTVGQYFYMTNKLGPNEKIIHGSFRVIEPPDALYQAVLSVGGIEADQNSSCSVVEERVEDCPVLDAMNCNITTEPGPFEFYISKCYTPVIKNFTISGLTTYTSLSNFMVYHAGSNVIIRGILFGNHTCQTKVYFNEAICEIIDISETKIICTLENQEKLLSFTPLRLSVNTNPYGSSGSEKEIIIIPSITDFSPKISSLNGGNIITISGKAFVPGGEMTTKVMFGNYECDIISLTFKEIKCKTRPAPEGSYKLYLTPEIESDNMLNYSIDATPIVHNTTASGEDFESLGERLGNNIADAEVYLVGTGAKKNVFRYDNDDTIYEYYDVAEEVENDDEERKIFEELEPFNKFWGMFTNTESNHLYDSVKNGAWKIAGSKFHEMRKTRAKTKKIISRKIREAEQLQYLCTIINVTPKKIYFKCSVPAGTYILNVCITGLGCAQITVVSITPTITKINPDKGSIFGGALLTITGSSFNPSSTTVEINSKPCKINHVRSNEIECLTPENNVGYNTVEVTSGGLSITSPSNFTYDMDYTPEMKSFTPSSGLKKGVIVKALGTNFKFGNHTPVLQIKGYGYLQSSTFDSVSITADALDLRAGVYDIFIHEPMYGYSNSIPYVTSLKISKITPIRCGFGGCTITVEGENFDPSGITTYVQVCQMDCIASSTSNSAVITCIAPPYLPSNTMTVTCNVTVTDVNANNDHTLINGFTYDASLSSEVYSINPNQGGTAGGTTITISGAGFSSSGNSVTIGGSLCDITTESNNTIECVTNANSVTGKFVVMVKVPIKGIALTNEVLFYYIDKWSSKFTWGGRDPPGKSEFVLITKGQILMIDKSTEIIKILFIKGGQVFFDKDVGSNSMIALKAEYILITEDGSLSIGTRKEEYPGNAEIELHGNILSKVLPLFGAISAGIRAGTVIMHGRNYLRWTILAETANKGDKSIKIKSPCNWLPGHAIVIAATTMQFQTNENEQMKIDEVSLDGLTITLTEPLKYNHICINQTFGATGVETCAEVGLLDGTIKVVGMMTSDFVLKLPVCGAIFDADQFSVPVCFNGNFNDLVLTLQFSFTIRFHPKIKDIESTKGCFINTEFYNAGQAFNIGSYPLHFHMAGHSNSSCLIRNAMHLSFNRAFTVHATNSLRIIDNFVYNIMGHAIFLEDGVEEYNIINGNLVIFVRSSSSLLNEDVTPACFWIVNPLNYIESNRCAGSTHFGFWIRTLKHPDGPSETDTIFVHHKELGSFKDNSAHSVGRYGLWVFSMDGYFPKDEDNEDTLAKFVNFTAWLCERGAEVVFGGSIQFIGFICLDNKMAGMEFVEVIGPFGELGPGVFDSVIVGHSKLSDEDFCCEGGVVTPKKSVFNMQNNYFHNFDNINCSAVHTCSQCKDYQGGYGIECSGFHYDNSPYKLRSKWLFDSYFYDVDGTFAGTERSIVLPNSGVLPQACVVNSEISVGVEGVVCPDEATFHIVRTTVYDVSPSTLEGVDLIVKNSNGNTTSKYMAKRLDKEPGWMFDLPVNDTYEHIFQDREQITDLSYTLVVYDLDPEDYIDFGHKFHSTSDKCKIIVSTLLGNQTSVECADLKYHGDFCFEDTTVIYRVHHEDRDESRITAGVPERKIWKKKTIHFKLIEECPLPTPPPSLSPEECVSWHTKSTWLMVTNGNGENITDIPTEYQDIAIPKGLCIYVNEPIATLGRLYVYGRLDFRNTNGSEIMLNCSALYLEGYLSVGENIHKPFQDKFVLAIRGELERTSEDVPITFHNQLQMGWKAFGIYGGTFKAWGKPVKPNWTTASVTAKPGDKKIHLMDAVSDGWNGSRIAIGATGKSTHESEVRYVVNISDGGKTLDLDEGLKYEHLGVSHSIPYTDVSYEMRAEIANLDRNIMIIGSPYNKMVKDGFGARIFVTDDEGKIKPAKVELKNVGFRHGGQFDFADYSDYRSTINFHKVTGTISMKDCAFSESFNTAVFMDSNNGIFTGNAFFDQARSAIKDYGDENTFENNLGLVTRAEVLYFNPKVIQTQSIKWDGTFCFLGNPKSVKNNIAGGCEQICYQYYGELCQGGDPIFDNNAAHSAIYGVMVVDRRWHAAIEHECRQINGFYTWRIYDTAIYMHSPAQQAIVNKATVVDCNIGVFILGWHPSSSDYEYDFDKVESLQNSVIIASSPSNGIDYLYSDDPYIATAWANHWIPGNQKGNIGATLPGCQSDKNMFPKHPYFHSDSNPCSPGALAQFVNVAFYNFNTKDNFTHVAIRSNQYSEDGTLPLVLDNTQYFDCTNPLYLDKPLLQSINPSDCVDLTCDGLKIILITDNDGNLLKFVKNPSGTGKSEIISNSDFQWNLDTRYGEGDYRIPSIFRGTNRRYNHTGMYRDETACNYMPTWRAHICTGTVYEYITIESLDSDTFDRRLSPVAIVSIHPVTRIGYGYNVNGPQDHGWCFGYTCQERLSSFNVIVACNTIIYVAFSGSPPEKVRITTPFVKAGCKLHFKLYYPKDNIKSVYTDKLIKPVQNPTDGGGNSGDWLSLDTGTNSYDSKSKMLNVIVGYGPKQIEIHQLPALQLSFDLVIPEEDIYEDDNIIQFLADLFDIHTDLIKIMNVIREDKEERVDTPTVQVEAIITGTPTEDKNEQKDLDRPAIMEMTRKVIDVIQNGSSCVNSPCLKNVLVSLPSVSPAAAKLKKNETDPEEPTDKPYAVTQQELNEELTALNTLSVPILIPSYSDHNMNGSLIMKTFIPPKDPIMITVYTIDNKKVPVIGLPTAAKKFKFGSCNCTINGKTAYPYEGGRSEINEFVFVEKGDYNLKMEIEGFPDLTVSLEMIRVEAIIMQMRLIFQPVYIIVDTPFEVIIQLIDGDGNVINPSFLLGIKILLAIRFVTSKPKEAEIPKDLKLYTDASNIVIEGLIAKSPSQTYRMSVSAELLIPDANKMNLQFKLNQVLPESFGENVTSEEIKIKLIGKKWIFNENVDTQYYVKKMTKKILRKLIKIQQNVFYEESENGLIINNKGKLKIYVKVTGNQESIMKLKNEICNSVKIKKYYKISIKLIKTNEKIKYSLHLNKSHCTKINTTVSTPN